MQPINDSIIEPTSFIGLVACGGKSERMGMDKSVLVYHDQPQYTYVANMLNPFCTAVHLSVNEKQSQHMYEGWPLIVDAKDYRNTGPIAAVLSAHQTFPKADFLLVGCDYPFLLVDEIRDFIAFSTHQKGSVAFYNEEANVYEPLLAIYRHTDLAKLCSQFTDRQYSLQYFLRSIQAARYIPSQPSSIISADQPADYYRITKKNLETVSLWK